MGCGQPDVIIGPGECPRVPLENLDGWWNDPHFDIRVVRITMRVTDEG
ncbi:MAG: hypothetical protein AB7Y46_05855 [Armatimonadota bacterium]